MLHRLLFPTILVWLLTITANAGAVSSAELYRTAGEGHGKFEARVQFAAGDGIISSFFLWKDGSEMSDVYWNELDFEKLGADCELQTNSIYGLPQRTSEEHHPELTGLCEGYHTYTYEWTPEAIIWSVDGVELRRDTGDAAAAYADNASEGLQVRFNVWPGNASFGGNFSESSLPAYQYIDWVEYSEYTPGEGDDGSDYTLSWREDFDAAPSSGWATGSWESPYQLSTHTSANVNYVDGIAVLALTADDATGYEGTPPQDGMTDAGGAPSTDGTGGTEGVEDPDESSDDSLPALEGDQGGCSCSAAPGSGPRLAGFGSWALVLFASFLSILRWRSRRASKGRAS